MLDHKELDYVAHNLIPGFHRALHNLKQVKFVADFKDDHRWIAESTKIALYLDDTYPEHALLRRDEQLRQQTLKIDSLADELGVHVRRWALAYTLAQGDHALEIMMGEQGYLRQFEKISKPFLKTLVKKIISLKRARKSVKDAWMNSLMS